MKKKERNWNIDRYPDFEEFIIGVIDSHINNTLNKKVTVNPIGFGDLTTASCVWSLLKIRSSALPSHFSVICLNIAQTKPLDTAEGRKRKKTDLILPVILALWSLIFTEI